MFKKILSALAAFVVAFLGIAALQSPSFHIERSMTISAPASAVFAQVNDLRQWEAWSPWAKLDPNAKNTYEGPAAGNGAIMRWAGNSDVGEGSMQIIESRPDEYIAFQLIFLKPLAATNTAEFRFATAGDKTTVTWSMYGQRNLMSKVFQLLFDCETMVGGMFEKGLAEMKSVVEASPKQ